ncbi:NAD(P)/FAD-dependent oxidoreductase [Actinomadura viridis]|uniref:Phthalate 3,4-dioxygenase ferredoxin reductase subunit n=1 Tax=Actinomadura viridis TaxID=58110 RepID=A0A931DGE2_9ACTN|nr:FAD-dependent oxidoreductase [Actinomadura viridis]MBG6087011.1 phthalate 3,4-dioxygenase ferredoxin reductase subunit [Actinomadura viridis]
MSTVVIVGTSVGGVRTAKALRSAGYAGEIVLVGAEDHLPYDRPPLSKAFLIGTATREDLTLLDREAASAAGIRLELGTPATAVDPAGRSVELADGRRLGFDELVIATGARPRPSPWGAPPGLHMLRTLDDALALREDLDRGGPLVIIGAGFIGAEIAATATTVGLADVTLVDPMRVPLSRVLNPAVAQRFGRLHTDRGVTTRFGTAVTGVESVDGGLIVKLDDGTGLPAATVVVGIGAVPNDGWLRGSGLTIADGVVCDQYSRARGAPNIHAVGDVARWFHPRHRRLVRAEHWTNAVEQADCVAHNITHPNDPRAHEPIEYVWTDQYDWQIQLVGRTGGSLPHVILPGADPDHSFAVLYSHSTGKFAGAVAVNWPRAVITCRKALRAPVPLNTIRETITAATERPRKSRTGT